MRMVPSRRQFSRAAPAQPEPCHAYPARFDASPPETGGRPVMPPQVVADSYRPIHDRLLPLKEVQHKVALGSSTIYRRIAGGTFPKPLHLSPGCVRWRESAIDAWITSFEVAEQAQIL